MFGGEVIFFVDLQRRVPKSLFGIAAVIIALSAGYFLVKRVLAPVKQPDRQVCA